MAVKKSTKVTSEELSNLQKLQNQFNELTFQFGQLYLSQNRLKEQENFLKTQLSELEKKEIEYAKNLTDKYGKGNLDLETGEFNISK
tara:strand:- start:162 stop:422 length:261 start_codon:yes stop_codon:yes gene_type:complete